MHDGYTIPSPPTPTLLSAHRFTPAKWQESPKQRTLRERELGGGWRETMSPLTVPQGLSVALSPLLLPRQTLVLTGSASYCRGRWQLSSERLSSVMVGKCNAPFLTLHTWDLRFSRPQEPVSNWHTSSDALNSRSLLCSYIRDKDSNSNTLQSSSQPAGEIGSSYELYCKLSIWWRPVGPGEWLRLLPRLK